MSDRMEPKRRGRPPKPKDDQPKRPRGRPPKVKEPEPQDSEMAAIDEALKRPITRHREKMVFSEEEIKIVGRLAAIFCTQEEICSVLNISRPTLARLFKDQPELREIYESGMNRARISLRRKQLDLASKLAPMAIFLGKNYLAQKDVQNIDATISKPANEMTEEALFEIASQALSETKPPKSTH